MAQFPKEQTEEGEFQRQEDAFRGWVSEEAGARHPLEAGRYHLYISLACPWASRTLIVRNLKRLQRVISMTVADPIRDEKGWAFREGPGYSEDSENGFKFLQEAYAATDPKFDGRVTVPVLWDKTLKVIVNNSEDDICRMFNDVFAKLATEESVNLFPMDLEEDHKKVSDFVYNEINNGVYKAGFATGQRAYEKAARGVFAALDEIEQRLQDRRFLLGEAVVEADWRLFCTLIRFDAVYHGHFKCNLRRIVDYPNLSRYLNELYLVPGVSETVNFDHIKRHYYVTHDDINPTKIVPIGPELGFLSPAQTG